jgi:translation initiation factor IF-3
LGIKAVPDALRLARGLELDLVEVAPMANPPVCRIMDYGKFRYEEAQKAKESRKKSTNVSVKEVKFRPKIGRGDFDVKVRKVDQFIHEGHKVKVTLQFRGREMAHPELGTKILDQVLDVVGTYVKVETQARLEGRNMSMVLSPDKKALDTIKAALEEAGIEVPTPAPIDETEVDTDDIDDIDVDDAGDLEADADGDDLPEVAGADVAEVTGPAAP